MKTQTIQKLIEIIDGKVAREVFFDICLSKNVLSNRNGAKTITLFHQNRVVDTSKVLENREGVVRQFHSIRIQFHHWG